MPLEVWLAYSRDLQYHLADLSLLHGSSASYGSAISVAGNQAASFRRQWFQRLERMVHQGAPQTASPTPKSLWKSKMASLGIGVEEVDA